MDAIKDILLCRLCGINLTEGKYKDIFEKSTDLLHKIKKTIPITICTDDSGSKCICLQCYDKVILHYKFIQEVLEHAKELNNSSQVKSLFNEVTDLSKIYSDTAYTCPNCNVDLMILLVDNPQGCDYTFQISLAVIGHPNKANIVKERNVQVHKYATCAGSPKKTDAHIKDETKMPIHMKNTENVPTVGSRGLSTLQDETGTDYTDVMPQNKVSMTEIEDKIIPNFKEINSHKLSLNQPKIPKLEGISYEPAMNFLNCNYDSVDTLIKIDPATDTSAWMENESICKSEKDIYEVESQEISFEKDDLEPDENGAYKPCPKIMCSICGARYLSQLKYEFHMERHKLSKMNKYECTLCNKQASSENLLWDHYYHTHKSSQRFVCMECGKLFTKRCRLNGHQRSYNHTGIKEIQIDIDNDNLYTDTDIIQNVHATDIVGNVSVNCNLCGKMITDLDPDAINDLVTCTTCEDSTLSLMVDGNEAKVISPRQYHCSKCSKHFVRKERLEFHEMRHNENMNEFVCSTCGKDFSAENSLYEHYLFVHKGARPHVCELCGKSFQLKTRLKEHHRTHTGERPYQCDVCGQRCRTTNALKLHRKIHFSHNRYTCNVCNKSFSKKQNMNEHLEKHWKHDKNVSLPQLFTCPICLEDFPTYRMLKYHMIEIHDINNQDPILTKQKPWYECPQCHEKFKHQMSLKAHKERVHEGRVNPIYQCDICNASYRIKQLLVNHIKSKHNGEKRYKCAQCEKGFNDTKSLYNHILLHTGKKPFICEYCNMSFRRKDSRDHHRRKHTGEQPYQCPDCGESFSTYNNRSKHRKREHGAGDSECPECGEKCSGQQEIRIHLNKHLGEKLKKLQSIEIT